MEPYLLDSFQTTASKASIDGTGLATLCLRSAQKQVDIKLLPRCASHTSLPTLLPAQPSSWVFSLEEEEEAADGTGCPFPFPLRRLARLSSCCTSAHCHNTSLLNLCPLLPCNVSRVQTALSLAPESNSGVVSWSCSFWRLLEIRPPCIRNLFLPDWSRTTMDQIQQHLDPLKQFAKDSVRLIKR